jgi:F-type H+-transporting ATPase subunit b
MSHIGNSTRLLTGISTLLFVSFLGANTPPVSAFEARTLPATLSGFAAAPQMEHSESEHPAEEHGEAEAEHHSVWEEIFHWVNFLLLVGGLVYLVRKLLAPFLEERGKKIREDMDRSAKALADADQRLSVVEAKMKSMDEEMASLRQAAFRESAAEQERIEQAAEADARKVLAAAEQEIDAALKNARQELRVFTSELALGLAEKNIRASLTPASEQRILRNFLHDLSTGEANGSGKKTSDRTEKE